MNHRFHRIILCFYSLHNLIEGQRISRTQFTPKPESQQVSGKGLHKTVFLLKDSIFEFNYIGKLMGSEKCSARINNTAIMVFIPPPADRIKVL